MCEIRLRFRAGSLLLDESYISRCLFVNRLYTKVEARQTEVDRASQMYLTPITIAHAEAHLQAQPFRSLSASDLYFAIDFCSRSCAATASYRSSSAHSSSTNPTAIAGGTRSLPLFPGSLIRQQKL